MNKITYDTPNIASVEAAQYLNIPYDTFMNYVTTGLICYQLKGIERFYSRKELNRFRDEVLLQSKLVKNDGNGRLI